MSGSEIDFHEWLNRFDDALIQVFEEAIEAGPEEAKKAVLAFRLLGQRTISYRLSKIQFQANDLAREVVPFGPSVQ